MMALLDTFFIEGVGLILYIYFSGRIIMIFYAFLLPFTLGMLGNFARFLSPADSPISRNSYKNAFRVSKSLDPGQVRRDVGSDVGTNFLQMLSADDTSRQRVNIYIYIVSKL